LTDDGTKTHQGGTLNLCFKVSNGHFEVADMLDLTVKNTALATPTQGIVIDGAIQSATTPYATVTCTDVDEDDTNVCLVSFLLKADFYDNALLT
jgi:hypothetical protein